MRYRYIYFLYLLTPSGSVSNPLTSFVSSNDTKSSSVNPFSNITTASSMSSSKAPSKDIFQTIDASLDCVSDFSLLVNSFIPRFIFYIPKILIYLCMKIIELNGLFSFIYLLIFILFLL
jgi:hypothetical protein